ncbi:GNAT family N-acetyltransferase [Galbibacter orientalis]
MKREKTNVQIIPYENSHRDAFMDINYQWLTQYFEVTAYDKPFFENPRKEILDKSGYIFLASLENEIVGSVALERITDKQYTLAKMGVKPGFQGLRIG